MGERIVPDAIPPSQRIATMLLEQHIARYDFAATRCVGRRVLDLACGTGYGSRLLCEGGAAHVVGVDIDPDAIAYARQRYGGDNISFHCAAGETFDGTVFDAIVCLETIPHLEEPSRLVQRFRTMLAPGGLLVVSATTSGISGFYRFHRHDFTDNQLRTLAAVAGFDICDEFSQTASFELVDLLKAAWGWPRAIALRRLASRPYQSVRYARERLHRGRVRYASLTLMCTPREDT